METKQKEVKKVEEKKENLSRCELIRSYALKGVKNRLELAEKVFAKLKQANKLETKNGKVITLDTVKGQISSVINVIKKRTQNHWKKYNIVETETSFRFVVASK